MGRFRLKETEKYRSIIKSAIVNNDGTDSGINADRLSVINDLKHKDFFMERKDLMELSSAVIISRLKLGEKPRIIYPLKDSVTTSYLLTVSKYQPTTTFKGLADKCEILVATDPDFNSLYYTAIIKVDPEKEVTHKLLLNPNTNYWIKVRYKLKDLILTHNTEWSEIVNFTTDGSLTNYPSPTLNINGDINNLPFYSTITATFNYSNVDTEWLILDQNGEVIKTITNSNVSLLDTLEVTPDIFESNKQYTISVKYLLNNNISYSETIAFTMLNTSIHGLNTDIVNLPIAVAHHGQSTTIDNNIIITGGITSAGVNNKTFIYFKEYNNWIRGADMPYGVFNHAQITVDERIYVLGGERETSLPYFQIYNLNNNTWNLASNMPLNIKNFGISLSGKKIIITGGDLLISNNPILYTKSTKTLIYDTETNIWSFGPELDSGISKHLQFTADDGNIIISGGEDINLNILNVTKKIFIDTPNSTPVIINPAPINFIKPVTAFNIDNEVVIISHIEDNSGIKTVSKKVYFLSFDGIDTVLWSLFQSETTEYILGGRASNIDSIAGITETGLIMLTGGYRDPGTNSVIENLINLSNKTTIF